MSTTSSLTTSTNTTSTGTTTSISGMASGLNDSSIISALMTAASAQKTALQAQLTTAQTKLTDYQSLNSSLASLTTSASSAAKGSSLAMSGTSTDSSITVTASTGATASSMPVEVTQLAKAQSVISGTMSTWPDSSDAITIVGADGTSNTLTAASSSMADVVSAINNSDLGVTATLVTVSGSSSTPTYRLELTSNSTGAASAFTVYAGSSAEVTAGTATDLSTMTGGSVVSTAQDASITLWPGTSSAQTVTNSTNIFTGILSNVSIAVSAVQSSAATITVTPDSSTTATNVSTLVSAVQTILSYISTNDAATQSSSTDSSGNTTTSTTFGAFGGDTAITRLSSDLLAAVQSPVNGVSPATIGITVSSTGTISVDSSTFESAMQQDPTTTMSMFQAIAARIKTVASAASDSAGGTLTQSITSQQSNISNLDTKISDWTTRLATEQSNLEAQFTAMETAVAKLNSVQTYLTQQMDAWNKSS